MTVAFEIVYTIADDDGDTAEFGIDIPTTFSLAQYTEFAQSMAQLVDPIKNGLLTNAGLRVTADLSALTGNTAQVAGDVQDVGAFQFRTGDNRPVRVNVPALEESNVASGSDDLNQADPDVSSLISAMTNGIAVTGGTIQPCDVDEDDITILEFARERFRSK